MEGKETSFTTVGVPREYLKDLVWALQEGYQLEEIEVRSNHVRFRLKKENSGAERSGDSPSGEGAR